MSVSAELFLEKWAQYYDKKLATFESCWSNATEYTKEIELLCKDIAKDLALELCPEYYSTDMIFCKEDDVIYFGNTYVVTNPEIVFEHENEPNKFIAEVSHHIILRSNLYVVVGYGNSGTKEYLKKVIDLINKSTSANEFKEKQNFLLILGDEYEKYSPSYWKGLVYDGDEWKTLQYELKK